MSAQPNFDRIAKPYQFLEYLTLGSTLQRCRTHHLPALLQQKSALVLGDGDGRFLAQLLSSNPEIRVDAIDTSRTMLDLLEARCKAASPTAAARLTTHQADARRFVQNLSPDKHYDLIVTHFFLDCLTQPDLEALIQAINPHLAPNALWLLSDFRIPTRRLTRPLAQTAVRSLYFAFRLLTGLRTTRLPGYTVALTAAHLVPVAVHHRLSGILTTELWQVT
ncbi:MAG: Methyltransferase type 12 [Acidobacteriaceae bacterium]|nr:Methyltransferase type 12 [Acidobacteriaceae bacterium]